MLRLGVLSRRQVQASTASVWGQSFLSSRRHFSAVTNNNGNAFSHYVHAKDTAEKSPSDILKPDLATFKKLPSLDEPIPGLPVLKPASQLQAPRTETTVLPNGLRVISQETYGQASTVGLFVDAGSRFEDDIGAQTTASSGREQLIYTVDVLRDNVDKALALLADAFVNPAILDDEIEMTKVIMKIQSEDLKENPQLFLQERVHTAAYGAHHTLGRPLQCPLEHVDALDRTAVTSYMNKFFVAPRIVLAGSGIEHAVLVEKAKEYFGALKAEAADDVAPLEPAVYRGGLEAIENADAPFSYASLAFPTGGWHHEVHGVDSTELSRAKNQLKSSVLMNLESRMILYEDIGRQLLTYGIRESPESICDKVDAVTAADVQRVVREAMAHKPSLVYMGKLSDFPSYDNVAQAIDQVLTQQQQSP
ncbi:hypothetical protein DYB37_002990 [Aphanomyces astaci]|uniref:Peptidase M16 C-terminal domain-containing protein n=1 Tax=Aphanomyces astaci TaxID=112090 RepID=A0A418DCY8_APHAT|nr:hypothetical protein DYB35_004986 [Aphanomyces astaci]RHZ22256.1 hypothetical protein DYB37_002990 [Aphanomyces astaci]